jgi:cell volume regulation protein A
MNWEGFDFELAILSIAVLLLLSVIASKASYKLGVPALLLFLFIGMLAGSEGIGGIEFDDAQAAQILGIIALAYILFAGGLDTRWRSIRPVLGAGAALASIGVFLTALVVGLAAFWLFEFSLLEALLLGAIVSSTDAQRYSVYCTPRRSDCGAASSLCWNWSPPATTRWRSS